VLAHVAAVSALVLAAQLLALSFTNPGPGPRTPGGASSFGVSSPGHAGSRPGSAGRPSHEVQGTTSQKAGVLAMIAAICVAFLAPPAELSQVWPSHIEPANARQAISTGAGDKVNRDPISLLQLAIPLEELLGQNEVKAVRELQKEMEGAKQAAVTKDFERGQGETTNVLEFLTSREKDLLKPFDESRKAQAKAVKDELEAELKALIKAEKKAKKLDEAAVEKVAEVAIKCQQLVGKFEELMVPPSYQPKIPKDYKNYPVLNGRATIQITLAKGPKSDKEEFILEKGTFPEVNLKLVVDGYSAPVSAGAFVELINKGFYNGMEIQRSDGFIIQTGDPGPEQGNGYIPEGGKYVRNLPLEVGIRGRKEGPLYGETIDEARMVGSLAKTPFQADGTLSWARKEFENDSASSQWFLFLFDSDMTPAGKNFLDGRYSSFGYVVEGQEWMRKTSEGDIVKNMKVLDGMDNYKTPSS